MTTKFDNILAVFFDNVLTQKFDNLVTDYWHLLLTEILYFLTTIWQVLFCHPDITSCLSLEGSQPYVMLTYTFPYSWKHLFLMSCRALSGANAWDSTLRSEWQGVASHHEDLHKLKVCEMRLHAKTSFALSETKECEKVTYGWDSSVVYTLLGYPENCIIFGKHRRCV